MNLYERAFYLLKMPSCGIVELAIGGTRALQYSRGHLYVIWDYCNVLTVYIECS